VDENPHFTRIQVTGHFGPKTLWHQDTSALPKCPDSSAPRHFGTKTFRH